MANVGANLESLRDQASKTAQTGQAATQFHATAQRAAASFRDEVAAMARQVAQHMDAFGDDMEQVSQELVQTVEATEWEGRAREAKDQRIADIHGQVRNFRNELEDGTGRFHAELNQAIEAFFTAVADRAGATVEQMHETWEAESRHADKMAQSLEDLDAAAAGNA